MMTVLVAVCSTRFHGSGNAGPFTWSWRFLANSHLRVYRVAEPNEEDASLEERQLLVEGVDYSVTGAKSYSGGSLTLLTSVLAGGHDLIVERKTDLLQELDLRNQGDFFPDTYEDALDKKTMVLQDQAREGAQDAAVISGLRLRMANAEEAIGDATATMSAHAERLDAAESAISEHGEHLDAVDSTLASHDERITAAAGAAEAVDGRLDAIESGVDGLTAGIARLYFRAASEGPVTLAASGSAIVGVLQSDETGDDLVITPSVVGQTICGLTEYRIAGAGVCASFVLNADDNNWYKIN